MTHPLVCWDIFLEGQSRRKKFAPDLEMLHHLSREHRWRLSDLPPFDAALIWENRTIILTDSSIHIIFASSNLFEMTGYKANEVVGRSPSMFQGARTMESQKAQFRKAIAALSPFHAVVTNYRKNGSLYACEIEGYPLLNLDGAATHFIAFESAVL